MDGCSEGVIRMGLRVLCVWWEYMWGRLQDGQTGEYIVGLTEKTSHDFNTFMILIKRAIEDGTLKRKSDAVNRSADHVCSPPQRCIAGS